MEPIEIGLAVSAGMLLLVIAGMRVAFAAGLAGLVGLIWIFWAKPFEAMLVTCLRTV